MTISDTDRALALVRATGAIRPRDLAAAGLSPRLLGRLMERGLVDRVARGVYVASDAEYTEGHALAEAAKRVPNGVVCLLSSLRYHELTTQLPWEVWIGIGNKAWAPRESGSALRVIRYSASTLALGVEHHTIEGVDVVIFDPAKTVVDCFKYRGTVGFDVALEALRDCWRRRLTTMDELWRYAEACRMTNVMRPYLESLL